MSIHVTDERREETGLGSLFEPGSIGRLELRNRLVQSAMHTRFATTFGEVSDRLVEYHRERAAGGVGLIVLENTAVDWAVGRAAGNPVRIDDDMYLPGLHDMVEAVHAEGAAMATQLHHAGRQNTVANTDGAQPVAPSPVQSKNGTGDMPRELARDELSGIVAEFADGARRTVQAGFDAVEIHGSHGYLLTQFLSPYTNHREDEYGGSFENRSRFPLEVVRAVREAVGPDYPVIYRISLEERVEGGMSAEEGVRFCRAAEPYVDAFNVTAGIYESMNWIFTMQGVAPGSLLPLARRVKREVSVPVIGISRLGWALEDAARSIEDGELDFLAMARTQLADPRLVEKARRGESARIRRCIACNECVGGFLFKGWRTQCVINPELGQERRARDAGRPAEVSRTVLVVGGGPAGCEAAALAARRGHRVTLVEREERLGGQLVAASAQGAKRREMEALIAYYENELEALSVEVRLDTEADTSLAEGFDRVLLATGTTATAPDGTIDAVGMLAERGTVDGDEVVVYGAGEIAMSAASYLAEEGKRVRLLCPAAELGADVNPLLAGQMQALLAELGVEIELDASAPPSAGTVVWAGERQASAALADLLDDSAVRAVGTRARGGRLYEATQSGYWTAAEL